MAEPQDFSEVWAWRCENCREWYRPAVKPYIVVVMEPGADLTMVTASRRLYTRREMAVCPRCHADMRR